MKKAFITIASMALISPLAFSNVVKGCSDPGYVFSTVTGTQSQRAAAKQAKAGFCKSAEAAKANKTLGGRQTF